MDRIRGSDKATTKEWNGFDGRKEIGGVVGASSNTFSSSTGSLQLVRTLWTPTWQPSLTTRVTSTRSSACLAVRDAGDSAFFFRKSALRLAFLRLAEGLFLLVATGGNFSLVFNVKVKPEPVVREKVKAFLLLASA